MVATLALLLLLPCAQAAWQVKSVEVLTRHGHRGPLPKDPYTNEENSGALSALTPQGELECFASGQGLRSRYVDAGSGFSLPDVSTFSLSKVTVTSSDTDRTIASALSLSYGMYPPAGIATDTAPAAFNATTAQALPYSFTVVPVHTMEAVNDVDIRAYDKCDAYNVNLENLYVSDGFLAYEQQHAQLLNQLQTDLTQSDLCTSTFGPDGKIALADFYNVYDCLNTASPDVVLPAIGQNTFNEVLKVADWFEQQRYAPAMVGRMLGGNIVTRVMGDFADVINGTSTNELTILSAHYPTQKSVLSDLGLDAEVYGIPAYACYLAFELLSDAAATNWAVRFMFRDGPAADIKPLFFPTTAGIKQAADGTVAWPDLQAYLKSTHATYDSYADWCAECGNTTADVCLQAQVESGSVFGSGDGSGSGSGGSSSKAMYITLSLFGGLLGGALLGFLGGCWFRKGAHTFQAHKDRNRDVV